MELNLGSHQIMLIRCYNSLSKLSTMDKKHLSGFRYLTCTWITICAEIFAVLNFHDFHGMFCESLICELWYLQIRSIIKWPSILDIQCTLQNTTTREIKH